MLTNVQRILEGAGASFAGVPNATTYLTGVDDREKINPVRRYFSGDARRNGPFSGRGEQ